MQEAPGVKGDVLLLALRDEKAEQGTRQDMGDRGSLERWSLMVQMSARMAGVGGCSSRPRSHL